jgi:hypothetical protein
MRSKVSLIGGENRSGSTRHVIALCSIKLCHFGETDTEGFSDKLFLHTHQSPWDTHQSLTPLLDSNVTCVKCLASMVPLHTDGLVRDVELSGRKLCSSLRSPCSSCWRMHVLVVQVGSRCLAPACAHCTRWPTLPRTAPRVHTRAYGFPTPLMECPPRTTSAIKSKRAWPVSGRLRPRRLTRTWRRSACGACRRSACA